MIKKTKILWISMFAPISTASSGGSQTFNYYFKQFLQDDRFEIRLVSCGIYSERETVEKETEKIVHHIVYWGSKNQSLFEKLKNIESKFNLLNKNAGLISNSDKNEIIATIKKYKSDGYEPDVTILEWTNMVMLAKQIKKIYPMTKIVASEHDVTFIGYRRKYEYFTGTKKLLWKLKYLHEKRMEEEIKEVITLANTAPSACNRQATHVFVIKNREMMKKIEELHGGCKNFGARASAFALVTSDLSLYSRNEVKIPSYDAGIYSMNLLYALQIKGFYSCILNGSFPGNAYRKVHELTSIPERYDISGLIVIYKLENTENIRIAASPRRNAKDAVTIL